MKFPIFKLVVMLCSTIIAQTINNPSVPDFRISVDEEMASFIQEDPKLFANGTKEFIVAWKDYRNGSPTYYAQKYDSLGNKIGNNFPISSNLNIAFNEYGFINIKKSHYSYSSPYWDHSSMSMNGTMYDLQNNIISENIDLGGGTYPWCGTGWLGEGHDFDSDGDNFFYALHFGGELNVWNIDMNGNMKMQYPFSGLYGVSQISVASTKNTNLVAWVNAFYDILPPGIYASTFSDTAIISEYIYISEFPDSNEYYYYEQSHLLKLKVLGDSLFQLFYLTADLLELNYLQLNELGSIVTTPAKIQLIENFEPSEYKYLQIIRFSISEINENSFVLYVTIRDHGTSPDYKETFYHRLLFFDKNGVFISKHDNETNYDYKFGGSPFITSGQDFFTSNEVSNNIYLLANNLFNKSDSAKINDDQSGSNENSSIITAINENKFLITWNNEIGNYGRIVNSNGEFGSERIILEGKNGFFTSNERYINLWQNKTVDDIAMNGFTIYDENWNVLERNNLKTDVFYHLTISGSLLADSTFVIFTENGESGIFYRYDKFGTLLKQQEIEPFIYGAQSSQILLSDINTFWLVREGYIQKYSYDLEPIGSRKNMWFTEYLGNDKFVRINYEYDLGGMYGVVLNSDGDSLSNRFIITTGIQNDYEVESISESKFIVTYRVGNDIIGKVISIDGIPENNGFKITNAHDNIKMQPNISINNSKVFFTWSDLREGNLGYDIFGNIYDLNVITGIDKFVGSKTPSEFSLSQNYPNPFNPTTIINYEIPEQFEGAVTLGGSEKSVTLKVFDVLGREVNTLVNKPRSAGKYSVSFDASNLSSGIYYYQLTLGEFIKTKKMVLLK